MQSCINRSFIISVFCQSDEVHIQTITRVRPEVFTSGLVRVPFWEPVNIRTNLNINDTQLSYAVVLVKLPNFVPLRSVWQCLGPGFLRNGQLKIRINNLYTVFFLIGILFVCVYPLHPSVPFV